MSFKKIEGEISMNISLPVIFVEEDNQVTAHTPVLDLATCGKDFNEAKSRFEEILVLFFKELCKMGTLEEVLLDCGWKKVGRAPTNWKPPRVVGSITEDFKVPCLA